MAGSEAARAALRTLSSSAVAGGGGVMTASVEDGAGVRRTEPSGASSMVPPAATVIAPSPRPARTIALPLSTFTRVTPSSSTLTVQVEPFGSSLAPGRFTATFFSARR
jgi:hypothetical protein